MPPKGWKKQEGWVSFVCEECLKKTETRKLYYERHQYHFCSRDCQCKWQSRVRIGEANPYFNPDKISVNYKKIITKVGNRWIPKLESRMIMENYTGKKIMVGEEVHHIDGNPKNNAIGNLHLCSNRKEHRQFHKRVRRP